MSLLVLTRMGDGAFVKMTESEVRKEVEAGVEEAVKKAKCSPLTEDDIKRLIEIICEPRKFVSVERE